MRKLIPTLALTLISFPAIAMTEAEHPRQLVWPFDGATGTFDRQSIQRGFQVYKEVCAACHGLDRVAFRSLADIGFSEAEIKALAATYTVQDGPNDDGEMYDRPAVPSDRFSSPFPNEKASRAANGGAYPPDLSLIIKARHDGANYMYSLLTGYKDAPEDMVMGEGMNYNPYFAGGQIAMPAPLSPGRLEYMDGTEATVDQMARDVTQFLQWAAEPEMEQRKGMGIKVMIFLVIVTFLFFLAKRRIWKDLH